MQPRILSPNPDPGEDVCAVTPGRVVVYVDAAGGNDGNAGTGDAPMATIEAGIARAGVQAASASVFVAAGVYQESLELADGVSLRGGFDATAGWARDPAAHVTEVRGQGVVVAARDVNRDTWLDGLTITGADATASGQSSIAVQAARSSGLRMRGVLLRPGNGDDGERGEPVDAPTLSGAPGPGDAGGNSGAGDDGQPGSTGTDGAGGAGGGGGGPSIGIVCGGGSSIILSGTQVRAGNGGDGGASEGNPGEPGLAAPALDCGNV